MYVDKEERTPPSGGIPAVDLHTSADCPAPQHASPGLFTVENTRASETNTASDISAIETKAKPTVLARWPPAAGLSTASAGESFAGQKEAISKHAPESSKKTEVVPKNGGARAGRPELASVTVGQDSITDAAADSAGEREKCQFGNLRGLETFVEVPMHLGYNNPSYLSLSSLVWKRCRHILALKN